MTNFSVSPMGLTFPKVTVQGPVPGLYASPSTLTFNLKNTSGLSVTITNYGFSTSTEGDAITQPAGVLIDTDFKVIPTGGVFPITVANGATQSFTVTYSPLRRGSGFGDVRSDILTLFAGNKVLTNGSRTWAQLDLDSFVSSLNPSGEVVDMSIPVPVTVGVGGGVIEEGYDWPSTSPIFWSAGTVQPGTLGIKNNVQGMSAVSTLADLDTFPHQSPMMFSVASHTSSMSVTSYIPPTAATYTTGAATVPYSLMAPATNGSPRGGRSYQILVFFADDTVTMDITIFAVTNAGNVQVAFFPAVTYKNCGNLFVGNSEGLDLQGLSLVASTNVTAGSTAYNVGAVITG